jgi:hypothetical protein
MALIGCTSNKTISKVSLLRKKIFLLRKKIFLRRKKLSLLRKKLFPRRKKLSLLRKKLFPRRKKVFPRRKKVSLRRKKVSLRRKKVPDRPYTIKRAVEYEGRPGGPKRAPRDGPPEVKTIWAGLQKRYALLDYRELFDFMGQV